MKEGRRVTDRETRLYNLQKPLNLLARLYKQTIGGKKLFTVRELLKQVGIDEVNLPEEIKKVAGYKVSQICRAGSRFEKNCICVQLYDDGYLALKWAMEHGALFCITDTQYKDIPCLVVKDPTNVYARLCRFFYEKYQTEVIAIAGSIGKTTTKNMVESVLNQGFSTFCDPDNENQIDCIGYMCQHIPSDTKIHIQEVSEDTPGYISSITEIIRPKISIITSIDQSHIEVFGSQEKIAQEIFNICNGMEDDGVVIINYDNIIARSYDIPQKKITVSIENKDADFFAQNIKIDSEGLVFELCNKQTSNTVCLRVYGAYAVHNVFSAMYSYVTGYFLEMDDEQIKKGLATYRPSGIRQNVIRADNNIIYADCYNAVAESIASALRAAEEIPIQGKIIAVIGDVEETGEFVVEIHDRVMDYINQSKVDTLFAYGEKTCVAAKKYKNNFRESLNLILCDNKKQIVKGLSTTIEDGDLILFKASRKSELETVIEQIWKKQYLHEIKHRNRKIAKWRLGIIFN